ncbi:aminoimidazole riboside kinase [Bacillus lacus]|uniref:Aminoimidazole riboside kinase n=1 Tax=Metabacillus lacus TaxID=1983721 RepID=A0A7X2IWS1_9BACI|nr:aminoimidazole riboside kinase [Metabacillus lacus]MRX71205.1 aminoimidazole riboside kinase [Metabacillus lacus]
MKKGVISLGEALIDFIPLDEENTSYQKSPGGAPANVAVGLARLGTQSSFIGKVGKDVLGTFLKKTLTEYGVDTDQMFLAEDIRTGVVFVTNGAEGERSFDFYIDPSADRFLHSDEINEKRLSQHKILHIGSISMISSPAKEATQRAVELAKKNGMLISYDPNLRLGLWDSKETAKKTILSMMSAADFLKISEEELEFLTGESDIESGVNILRSYNIPLIVVTLGAKGSYVYTSAGSRHVPAMKVDAVDTTGAGDAFVSGMLYSLDKHEGPIGELDTAQAAEMAAFAAVSGALAASTKGAMTALPTLEEVQERLREKGE